MADERKAFLLRADPLLWRDIEKWAADELRSVNGQIEFILREALRRRNQAHSEEAPAPAPEPAPVDVPDIPPENGLPSHLR
jgi:hypothetical protein